MSLRSTQYGSVLLSSDFNSSRKEKERVWPVAVCSFIVCLASLLCGLMLSFSSPTLAELAEEPNPNRRILANQTTGSLFASFGTVGAALGSLTAWPISELLGRKAVVMTIGFPAFVGWLLIAFSAYVVDNMNGFVAMLLIGRLLTGTAAGISAGAVAVYVGEISSKKWRGFFGNWNQLFVTIGMLIGYALGTVNSVFPSYRYYHSALIAAGVVLPFEIMMLLPTTVESPRWLYLKGRIPQNGEPDYVKVLKYLRGGGTNARSIIQDEIKDIQATAENSNISLKQVLGSLKSFAVFWPLLLSIMLMFFQMFGGIAAVVFFSSVIFKQAHFNNLDSNLATLGAVGGVQFIGTLTSVFLIDRLGRKTLLVISSIGMLLSCITLGVYFHVYSDICNKCLGATCTGPAVCLNPSFGWLAITSIMLFMGSFSIGWGPVPWTMLSELLPDSIRTLASSVATLSNWLMATVVTASFEGYVHAVTPKFAWWSFAVVLLVSVFFIVIILPETRGLSFSAIQERFTQRKIIAVTCNRSRSGLN